jgi:hypothetical protein
MLKRGKSLGSDCLMNEYLIESIDILGAHICDIFNVVLNFIQNNGQRELYILSIFIRRGVLMTSITIEA